MRKSSICALLIVVLSSFSCFSQEQKIVELQQQYEEVKNKDLAKAKGCATKAVELGNQVTNDSLNAISNYYLSEALFKYNKISEAKIVVKKAIDLSERTNNLKILSLSYNVLSRINYQLADYIESLQAIEEAKKNAEELGNNEILHRILNTNSRLLKKTNNNRKAIALLKKAIDNKDFTEDENRSRSYNLLGIIYQTINKDSSVYFYEKALRIIQNTDNEYYKALVYSNLGDLFIQKDNYKKGLEVIKKSEEISSKIFDYVGLYYTNSTLATYYHTNKNYKKAIELYKKTLQLYSDYVEASEIAHLYWLFSEALYFDNQFKEGFLYQEKYVILKDSLFNVEKNKTFDRLQTEYEVEKKNSQIAYLEEKQALEAKQRKLIIGAGGLALFVLLLLVFLYRYRATSQKVIREQEQQLFIQEKEQLKQNEKIKRIEGYVEGEEKEKNRIALELHDGIGGQLSGIQHMIMSLPENDDTTVLSKSIGTVAKEVRLLSHSLSTSFSELQPFESLLATIKARYQNHFDIEISIFPEEEVKNLANTQKIFLYRSIQELVNNVYKHAKASWVQLSLTIADEIVLMIEDNGIGFNTETVPDGIGLQNMAERTQYLKGEFTIDTKENEGTTIMIKIPREDA
ncbi:tetratricopeptide repeat-containing sensor histidine kinase [Tenacibaculum agarivorans]|uniref:tetratricopeptide repeat-containing sensor histidine kinase n=1 Tax=Tenacibaculum agarivorans TaxID=1908389 RepID=UPI00094B8940|nr:tetratricopeptide repeat-containing sensor histidine kinase [Tenacibaculum agarivorans]